MRKNVLLFAMIVVATFASCTKESTNPTSNVITDDQSESYFPLKVGNSWEYSSTLPKLPTFVKNEIEGQTVINGKTYFVMNSSATSAKTNYRYENNVLYSIGVNGFGFDETKEYVLNNFNQSIGDSLVFVGTNPQGFPMKTVFIIKAKGATRTIKGVTYSNVIAYDNLSYYSFIGTDWTLYSTFSSYYGKGVGYLGGDYGASGTYDLSSYNIK
ncbi:MAG: hypothetical protein IPM69_01595 [Ignavibacteria bacterium]|nr:hypothetical protein [Ignavibacteria bacterium]